jgi:hypothetical protein
METAAVQREVSEGISQRRAARGPRPIREIAQNVRRR